MKELVELLKEKKLTIASCESLTAGLFSSRIAEIPGASNVLVGAIVTYATRIKEEIVHVDPKIIEQEGVVSAACAKAMAENTRKLLQADLCVSFTGNAGPACMRNNLQAVSIVHWPVQKAARAIIFRSIMRIAMKCENV